MISILSVFLSIFLIMITALILNSAAVFGDPKITEPLVCFLIYLATCLGNSTLTFILLKLGACKILVGSLHKDGHHHVNSPIKLFIDRYTCMAISNLSASAEARAKFLRIGICATLIKLMKLHISDIKIINPCCTTFSLLCSDASDRLLEIPDIGDTLMASLATHKDSLPVVQSISRTISTLASTSYAIRYKISEAGGCNLLIAAFQRHRNDLIVSEHISKIISYLAGCGELQRVGFFESGACEELNGALVKHFKSSAVAAAACSGIQFLATSQEAKRRFNELGTPASIRTAIREHSYNVELESQGNNALAQLWDAGP